MRTTRHLLALFLAALLAIAAPALTSGAAADPVTTGYAYGWVSDDFFDDDLEGVSVSLYAPGTSPDGAPDYQGTTDTEGDWRINEIEAGPYSVVFSKAGFETQKNSISIHANSGSSIWSTYLVPNTWGTLSGTLNVGGTPLSAGCGLIEIYRPGSTARVLSTDTMRAGSWSVLLPAGSYQVAGSTRSSTSAGPSSLPCRQGVNAWVGGADQSSATVLAVTKNATTKAPLNLLAHPIISGVVTDAAKKPLANIVVEAADAGVHTLTDANGRYTLAADPGADVIGFVDPAEEYLPAFHNGTTTVDAPAEIELLAGAKLTMNAVLKPDTTPAAPAALTGRVTDSTGKPMRGVMVMVMEPGDPSGTAANAFTRTNGTWSVARDAIDPGTYTAGFMAAQSFGSFPEFDADPLFYGGTQNPAKARTFTVGTAGPALNLGTVALTRLGSISGTSVTDATVGEAGDQLMYTLTDGSGNLAAMSMGIDDFSFTSLKPGRYKVSASSLGVFYGGIGSLMMPPLITAWYGGLTASQAKWITVAPGAKVTGIKINLTNTIRNATKPKATGSAKVGKTLKANPGTWNQGTDVTYTYTWKRGSKTVGTKSSYKVTKADAGKKLTVTVRASHRLNSFNPGSATSPGVKVAKVKKKKR